MPVRRMRQEDFPEVTAMMHALWPEEAANEFSNEQVFVWDRDTGGLGGFISLSLRSWAEGCESVPVPYIEGWWVAPDLRLAGVGRALVDAAERWCRERGHLELGSDFELQNDASLRAHAALGFDMFRPQELNTFGVEWVLIG